MATTKIYKNTGKENVFVVGVGEIEGGQQVSVTSDYHEPVVLANYPTIVEVTADDYVEPPTPAKPATTTDTTRPSTEGQPNV